MSVAPDYTPITLSDAISKLREAVTNATIRMEELDRADLSKILPAFNYISENADYLADLSKELNSLVNLYSEKIIPDLFESNNTTAQTCIGREYKLGTTLYASISEAKKKEGFKWLEDNGMGALIKPTVHPRALSSALDSFMQETAICPPSEAISIYIKKSIRVSKKR